MTLLVTLPPGLRSRARVAVEPAGRMAFSRRGDRLIVGGANSTVVVDLSGQELERWPRAYTSFACGFADGCVAAATARGYVDLWRFGGARPGEPRARHEGRVHALAFSADDGRIFTAGDDGRVGCWRAATLEAEFWPVGGHALDLAYDGGSDALAVAVGRGGVVVLDGRSGARRGGVRPPDRSTAVAWVGGLLAVGTREGQLALYDGRQLAPVRAAAALGLGALWRVLPLAGELVVEGHEGLALLDPASGRERLRFSGSIGREGGAAAVHAGQRVVACAVPAGAALYDLAPPPPERADEVLALYHAADAALCRPVLAALAEGGARLVDAGEDPRRLVEAVRRGAACVLLYGPRGPWPRHDWQLDVLQTRGARMVPVILPGGVVPEAQRRFHGAAYVCFHERVQDADALDRVARAVLGRRPG